jgi:uncharacterized protein YecE (DUF72 family)
MPDGSSSDTEPVSWHVELKRGDLGWARLPSGTTPAEFLPTYATDFNTVEIDSTYYGIRSKNAPGMV